jgi:hypothetical protein
LSKHRILEHHVPFGSASSSTTDDPQFVVENSSLARSDRVRPRHNRATNHVQYSSHLHVTKTT